MIGSGSTRTSVDAEVRGEPVGATGGGGGGGMNGGGEVIGSGSSRTSVDAGVKGEPVGATGGGGGGGMNGGGEVIGSGSSRTSVDAGVKGEPVGATGGGGGGGGGMNGGGEVIGFGSSRTSVEAVVVRGEAVCAGASAGFGLVSRLAARQSHSRMVFISASRRSSTDCPLRNSGGSWVGVGGSMSVTLPVPFVVTSVDPNPSFTGHSRCAHNREPSAGRRHRTWMAAGVSVSKLCQTLASNVAAREDGQIACHLKFGRWLLGCHFAHLGPGGDQARRGESRN